MSFAARSQDAQPCDGYVGNLCSGFGGSLICLRCGWGRSEHPSEQQRLTDWLKGHPTWEVR